MDIEKKIEELSFLCTQNLSKKNFNECKLISNE